MRARIRIALISFPLSAAALGAPLKASSQNLAESEISASLREPSVIVSAEVPGPAAPVPSNVPNTTTEGVEAATVPNLAAPALAKTEYEELPPVASSPGDDLYELLYAQAKAGATFNSVMFPNFGESDSDWAERMLAAAIHDDDVIHWWELKDQPTPSESEYQGAVSRMNAVTDRFLMSHDKVEIAVPFIATSGPSPLSESALGWSDEPPPAADAPREERRLTLRDRLLQQLTDELIVECNTPGAPPCVLVIDRFTSGARSELGNRHGVPVAKVIADRGIRTIRADYRDLSYYVDLVTRPIDRLKVVGVNFSVRPEKLPPKLVIKRAVEMFGAAFTYNPNAFGDREYRNKLFQAEEAIFSDPETYVDPMTPEDVRRNMVFLGSWVTAIEKLLATGNIVTYSAGNGGPDDFDMIGLPFVHPNFHVVGATNEDPWLEGPAWYSSTLPGWVTNFAPGTYGISISRQVENDVHYRIGNTPYDEAFLSIAWPWGAGANIIALHDGKRVGRRPDGTVVPDAVPQYMTDCLMRPRHWPSITTAEGGVTVRSQDQVDMINALRAMHLVQFCVTQNSAQTNIYPVAPLFSAIARYPTPSLKRFVSHLGDFVSCRQDHLPEDPLDRFLTAPDCTYFRHNMMSSRVQYAPGGNVSVKNILSLEGTSYAAPTFLASCAVLGRCPRE